MPKSAIPTSDSSEPASPADNETKPRVPEKIFSGFSGLLDVRFASSGIARVTARVAEEARSTHFQSSLIMLVGAVYCS